MTIIPIIIIGSIVVGIAIIVIKIVVSPRRVQHLAQLYKQRKYTTAIKIAKQILAKDPRNHEAHYYLGLCYLADKKPELALMELKIVNQMGVFDGAINEEPFRNTIAELFVRFNQTEEAQKEYLLLIKLNPNNAKYYYEAGVLFELRNQADKAVKYYKKATELDRRHADAFGRLGSILYRAKRLTEARDYLEQAVKLQAENVHACFSLGKIYKEAKEFQAALRYFEKSMKSPELKSKSLLERATCYISMGDLGQATIELDRAIRSSTDDSNPESLYSRYLLAYCYEQSRNFNDALVQWERIQELKPNFRDVPAKLEQYQDLRSEDVIKDYLTFGDEDFQNLCIEIIQKMGNRIQDSMRTDKAWQFATINNQNTKWRNAKQLPTLYQFVRDTDTIEEPILRDFHEAMKAGNYNKGVFVSCSNFSRGAREFTESRPIELVDKDRILSILK